MVCINCFHKKTAVINSRPLQKNHETWRRRQCPECHHTFTTRENIDYSELLAVFVPGKKSADAYDKARLTISLLRVFDSVGLNATDAYWLTETIQNKLIEPRTKLDHLPATVTKERISEVAYETLLNYHSVAGLTYGAAHGIVKPTNKRSRGRPRLTS